MAPKGDLSILTRGEEAGTDSPTIVESEIDRSKWPMEILDLERIFQSLAVVCTFCSAKKQLAAKFDTIKSGVEKLIGRQLEVSQFAQIKYLVPDLINFAHCSTDDLESDANDEERLKHRDLPAKSSSVLILEFSGDNFKKRISRINGQVFTFKKRRKLPNSDASSFALVEMRTTISKRNLYFQSAVHRFLQRCAKETLDPVAVLLQESQFYNSTVDHSQKEIKSDIRLHDSFSSCGNRPEISDILQDIENSSDYNGQIIPTSRITFDARDAVYGDLPKPLSPALLGALKELRGIKKLYSHQAEAITHLWSGSNVVVSTSTSSGKSLIYQIPILEGLERDASTTAIFIFPTKALAQDQKKSLQEILAHMPSLKNIMVETFDGDTSMNDREEIRQAASVILTNPDILHVTILPQEGRWRTFLQHLSFVVVDELHVYDSVFGTHMALIMRRLRRLCAAVGNRRKLQFISCTATLPNAVEHMKTIFGIENVALVHKDGSPSGKKEFVLWNPYSKDLTISAAESIGAMHEAVHLLVRLISVSVRTIVFCKVRRSCDLLLKMVREALVKADKKWLVEKIMSYRGGYTPQDRRKIERDMFDGRLLGIIATTALELGVDIGSLDAVIMVGFPYNIAGFRQQSGRAGRRNKDSLTLLIAERLPLDQHFIQHPEEIFTKPNASAVVDLGNLLLLVGHLQCAAYELPIRPDVDVLYFGEDLPKILPDHLILDNDGFYHCHPRFRPHPAKFVSIRQVEDTQFVIVDCTNNCNIVLEMIETSRAVFTLYEGAIYLHQGSTYIVKELNLDKKVGKVERTDVTWFTRQREYTDVDPIETRAIRRAYDRGWCVNFGSIRITKSVFGYFKLDRKYNIIDAVDICSPPIIINSTGMWIDVPQTALDILVLKKINIAGSIHAAEHVILSLIPNHVICSPGDIKTECRGMGYLVPATSSEHAQEKLRKRPGRLIFYDAIGEKEIGAGLVAKVFEYVDLILRQALSRIKECACDVGCLDCVVSPFCRHDRIFVSKVGAYIIFKVLLNEAIDVQTLQEGDIREDMVERVTLVDSAVKQADSVDEREFPERSINVLMAEEGGEHKQNL